MASLVVATIQHDSQRSPKSNEDNLARLDDRGNIPQAEEKSPAKTENSNRSTTSQEPNLVSTASDPEWRAGRGEWMIIIVLAIVSLMVALDATILVPVLPASIPELSSKNSSKSDAARLLRAISMAMQQTPSGLERHIY